MPPPSNKRSSNNDLMRYAGLATQMLVGLGVAVFVGLKADKWLHISFPVLAWVLPLLVLGAILYKIVKETGPGKKND
ncbi:MAG: AtpZ/AtpI family protein [Bacteroidota bacterium]|nr:AtpZ/AtpI family protein [Bacteroidota bacterium]